MASQNRRNYRSSNAPSGGLAFVRGTFIMLVVLILSFGMGFFVLARFMPGNMQGGPKPDNSHPVAAIASARDESAAERLPAPSVTPQPSARTQTPKPVTPRPDSEGPSIGPGEENTLQPPGRLDEPTKRTPNSDETDRPGKRTQNPDEADRPAKRAPNPDETDRPDPKDRPAPRRKAEPKQKADPEDKPDPYDVPGPYKPAPSGDDTPPVRPHRGSRKPAKSSEGDTPRTRTDTPRHIGTDGPQPADNPEGRTASKVGVYRVQLGAFDTWEQADQVVKDAMDKGFDAQIKVVKNGGQTLYKVQHSAHKTRASAEKEGQKLTDAGFSVYIANPNK